MMTVRNDEELKLFLDTVDQCEDVILVTPDGMEYDLKDLRERFIGLGKVIDSEEEPELEVYCQNREDVAKMLQYMESISKAA
ncbi:MAG: hypothetical protein K6C12_13990 [Oscillospiraceae bacterium]|nr:hypothetical protein [Oscillospiraceae bacterium]